MLKNILLWADRELDSQMQHAAVSTESPIFGSPIKDSILSFQLKMYELKLEAVKLEMDGGAPDSIVRSWAVRSKLIEARIKLRFFVEAVARVSWVA